MFVLFDERMHKTSGGAGTRIFGGFPLFFKFKTVVTGSLKLCDMAHQAMDP